MRVGFVTGQARPFAELVELWQAMDAAGVDNAWLIDHFRPEFAPDAPWLESWTTLAALAARTERLRIGIAVTNASIRHPAVLCKQAITVDRISDGRLDMAIGAGYYESEQQILGIDYLTAPGRSQRLREVAQVLDCGLAGDPVSLDGRFWRLKDVPMSPGPVQKPRIPLWIAASASASVQTAAMYGDVLVTLGNDGEKPHETLPKLRDRVRRFHAYLEEVGRQHSDARCAYLVGWADEKPYDSEPAFQEFIGNFAEAGVTDFVMSLAQAGGVAALDRLMSWIDTAKSAAFAR